MFVPRHVGRALVFLLLIGASGPALAEDGDTYAGKDARWWIQQLTDGEGAKAARVAFKKIGAPAREPLAEALTSASRKVRFGAVRALGEIDAELAPILAQLASALSAPELEFQRQVLALMSKTEHAVEPYMDLITPLIHSPDRTMASTALSMIRRFGEASRSRLPHVLVLVREGDQTMRLRAMSTATAIAADSPEVVSALAELLSKTNDRGRESLLQSARLMRPGVVGWGDLVARCSRDPSPGVRMQAAGLLADVALEDPERVGDLSALLGDSIADVRRSAAYALARLGTRAAPAVPALMRVLMAREPTAHAASIRALAAIGEAAEPATTLVLDAVDRKRPARDLVASARMFIAADTSITLSALERESLSIRKMALEIISNWSIARWVAVMPEAVPRVCSVLVAQEASTRLEIRILKAFGQLAPDHPAALAGLLDMHRAKASSLVAQAAGVLGSWPANSELLVSLLSSEDAAKRAFAYEALRRTGMRLGHPTALNGVLPLLHSERVPVRKLARRLVVEHTWYIDLAVIEARDGNALATAAASLLDDPKLRAAAVAKLGTLGVHAVPHLDALLKLLSLESLGRFDDVGAIAARSIVPISRSSDAAWAVAEPRLLALLRGEHPVGAACASMSLAMLARNDKALLKHLPALMKHSKKIVHFRAVSAAEHMGSRAAPLVPLLVGIVRNPTAGSHVDQGAVSALMRVAPDDKRFMAVVIELCGTSRRQNMRGLYVAALTGGRDTAVQMIAATLPDADAETRLVLLAALGRHGLKASSARDPVRALLEDPDVRVAKAAAAALKALGGSAEPGSGK